MPDLAKGLAKKLEEAHRTNRSFTKAFAAFFELCQTSLNPNISQATVDEMLIQHILTERLIREIFDNPEFVRRNVIAGEARRLRCDQIVMATARKNSLTRMIEDSTTNRVLELTSVPVEVIAGDAVSRWERYGIPAGIGVLLALLFAATD